MQVIRVELLVELCLRINYQYPLGASELLHAIEYFGAGGMSYPLPLTTLR